MTSLAIASIVFVCAFGSSLFGMLLNTHLPGYHLSQESKDVVKLAMGMIATMVALVLGLLTASAKGSFDSVSAEVQRSAASIIQLDRALARYGPETNDIRDRLKRVIAVRLALTWPEDGSPSETLATPELTKGAESLEDGIRDLSPQTGAQGDLKGQALQISRELLGTRWSVFAKANNQIPKAFWVMLVFWLSILFVSFGIYAPRNATVITALVLCAVAVAGSTFLILEMSHPLGGMIRVSSAPMRYALSQLGQ